MKIKNLKSLFKNFCVDAKEFSYSVAWARLMRDMPIGKWEIRRERYEKAVLEYLGNSYKQLLFLKPDEQEYIKGKYSNKVWVMWLQGEERMPPVVDACWTQMKRVFPSEQLVLLTEKNVETFMHIPDHIMEKQRAGIISPTHFSDFVRAALLNKYGGCWLDATLWIDSYPSDIIECDFYTLHAPGMFPEFIGRGNWSTFLLVSNNKISKRLFQYLEDALSSYWSEHDALIDYLMLDYFIKIKIEQDDEIKHLIQNIPTNYAYYLLNRDKNELWDFNEFSMVIQDSPIQKLTYKGKLVEKNEQGHLTNYGYILATRERQENRSHF